MSDSTRTSSYQPEGFAEVDATPPRTIGRYVVERFLGDGGFGIVYLARDEQLQRLVAIKVPHRRLVKRPEDAQSYLAEARTVANLDHTNIVPVHDVGSTPEFPCFVVSKFIEGRTLTRRIHDQPPFVGETVELIATVADTLHFAHRKGIVHRDIKPGNILLDLSGKPYVADFGLAIREEDLGHGPKFAGTPSYMSPEQARGEGHRVDGRSDIFSLGVVFYEMLTGRRPFRGNTRTELVEQITSVEARPPRQIDDRVPKELERICLKAMSKRTADRYTTAKDMADDLRRFLAQATADEQQAIRSHSPTESGSPATPTSDRGTSASNQPAVHILPKGLRSFDAYDAEFFLELLPGPRDRDGLPESIRFWKQRIEETDSTFSVGLIYGPSGCGKSSLIKAGLLPRLAANVVPIYVEATAKETESRLLNALRKHFPLVDADAGLTETLASLRRGQGIVPSTKVLIVLDQFEQWLHARGDELLPELAQALRHCDGERVQCIVLVRDDFWLAVSRFLRDLEVDLVPDRNIALVDLFDIDHARKILTAFGRAFGKLPEKPGDTDEEQRAFLKQAVASLSQDGRVICVRLALFADMLKGRPWNLTTLKEVGGAEGLGVAFLEETFSSPMANPKHRTHQKAARSVLKALLPDSDGDIKGNMRFEDELRLASGYTQPAEFQDLIRILDGEVRLITPTDPAGSDEQTNVRDGRRYYQLTHDSQVPSIRDWLTRKQKETRRGRAELSLAERAILWDRKREQRHLPSLIEWSSFRLFTRRRTRTTTQRKMLRAANRYYLARLLAVSICLLLVGWALHDYKGRLEAEALRDRLVSADVAEVPAILENMKPHRRRVDPLLQETLATETDPKRVLLLRLGLVPSDPSQVSFLYERLLHAPPQEFAIIRQVLSPYKADILGQLWKEFEEKEHDSERRFRAACALAEYAPDDPRWMACSTVVVEGLIAENPLALSHWRDALHPVRQRLFPALAESLENPKWGAVERRSITEFYRDFSGGEANALLPLEARLHPERPAKSAEQANRQANIGAALIALGRGEKVWPLLIHTPTPTLRSFLIERIGTSGVDPRILKRRLEVETDISAQRALILALGGSSSNRLFEIEPRLLELFEHDPDPGIHAAVGWVLRKSGRAEAATKISSRLATGQVEAGRGWYVNKERQTFSVINGPGYLLRNVKKNAPLTKHRFAIGAIEVTAKEFEAFRPGHLLGKRPELASAVIGDVSWHDAAAYCNWLSKREGILEDQWCFVPGANETFELAPDYQQRTGYRLPTEEEWEFGCRAGTESAASFGEVTEELIGCYAWWIVNSRLQKGMGPLEAARHKPNDYGLFDMYGNVCEWCQESSTPTKEIFFEDVVCAGRGSGYNGGVESIQSSERFQIGRKMHFNYVGFRVARTLP